jgi:hypothetical protein
MGSSALSFKLPARSGAERDRAAGLKPRKSHIGVMLASLVAGSATTVTALDSWGNVLVDLGLKKSEAVVLAEQGQRGDLLREMVRMISRRDFWAVRYSGEFADGFPQADLDEAWHRYNDSVVNWNKNYMLNALLTEKFFGEEAENQLKDLNSLLLQVNTCLNKIHYPDLYKTDATCQSSGAKAGSDQENIRAENLSVLKATLKQVDDKVGSFVNLLSK